MNTHLGRFILALLLAAVWGFSVHGVAISFGANSADAAFFTIISYPVGMVTTMLVFLLWEATK